MSPRYEVTIYSPEDVRWFSYVLAGLFDLEHAGLIRLRVRVGLALHHAGHYETRCRVRHLASGDVRDVVFDLKDSADVISRAAWERFDVVYKRSYQPARIAVNVPERHRHKIRPFGPFFNARSRHEHGMWRLYGGVVANVLRNADWRRIHRVKPSLLTPLKYQGWQRLRGYRFTPYIDEYESPPPPDPTATEPVVLFQTRVFAIGARDDPALAADKARVNHQRADLIRHMRAELGDHFWGGLIPDALSRREFPDVLATLPTERRAYLALARRARVVVFTIGLVGSPGRKLCEALAGSSCLVAERLPCELAVPLVDGRDVAFFDTPDEAVALCRALIDDPARAHAMARAAHAYYRAHASPAASVMRCLDQAFA